ncbi:MAG: LuxR C-terminal-related transcriptional regulator [Myxococcaceae bacterium]|nr:LuxR C-terminal-related transcriptional regulator [Myxococcaceae bacterium]
MSVWTCPPGHPLEARGQTSPTELHGLVEDVVTRYLPMVERGSDGALARRGHLSTRPYAPLESALDRKLAAKLRRERFGPAGVEGLVVSWLLCRDGLPLGFVGVGGVQPALELLAELSERLDEVAQEASVTLQGALELSAGCGALPPPPPTADSAKLTVRERQVARLVAEGLSDAEVAQELSMSEQTVGVHLRHIFHKLGIHSRSGLLSRGVVALGEPERPAAARRRVG